MLTQIITSSQPVNVPAWAKFAEITCIPGGNGGAGAGSALTTGGVATQIGGSGAHGNLSTTHTFPITGSRGTAAYQAAVQASAPVHYWVLDAMPDDMTMLGTVTFDAPDPWGVQGAGHFDAASQLISKTSEPSFSGPFSVEFWYRSNVALGRGFVNLSNTNGATASPSVFGPEVYTMHTGAYPLGGRVSANTGGGITVNVAHDPVRWFHVVFTFDGSVLRLYRDGVLLITGAATTLLPVFQGFWRIGRVTNYGWYHDGDLAHVAVYTKALSAGEVSTHYNSAGVVTVTIGAGGLGGAGGAINGQPGIKGTLGGDSKAVGAGINLGTAVWAAYNGQGPSTPSPGNSVAALASATMPFQWSVVNFSTWTPIAGQGGTPQTGGAYPGGASGGGWAGGGSGGGPANATNGGGGGAAGNYAGRASGAAVGNQPTADGQAGVTAAATNYGCSGGGGGGGAPGGAGGKGGDGAPGAVIIRWRAA